MTLNNQFDWKIFIDVDAHNLDLGYVTYNILTGVKKTKEQYENWREKVLNKPLP